MSKHPGLKQYLANWTADSERRLAISRTIEAITEACIEISALVARGPLAGELGAEKGDNMDGDTQKALDLIANDLIVSKFSLCPQIHLDETYFSRASRRPLVSLDRLSA